MKSLLIILPKRSLIESRQCWESESFRDGSAAIHNLHFGQNTSFLSPSPPYPSLPVSLLTIDATFIISLKPQLLCLLAFDKLLFQMWISLPCVVLTELLFCFYKW